jgi:hypothetical protein
LPEIPTEAIVSRSTKELLVRVLVLLMLAACASSSREAVPAAPPAIPETRTVSAPVLNPVGEFEFSTMTPDGTPIRGVISIIGSPGAYTGSVDAAEHGKFPIKSVVVSGQTMTINAEHPEGPLDVRLSFVADDFTGSWQLGTDTGEMAGKRKP